MKRKLIKSLHLLNSIICTLVVALLDILFFSYYRAMNAFIVLVVGKQSGERRKPTWVLPRVSIVVNIFLLFDIYKLLIILILLILICSVVEKLGITSVATMS